MLRIPFLLLILAGLLNIATPTLAQTPPFNVNFVSGPSTPSTTYPGSSVPTLFNMVVGSTQQLEFTITPNPTLPPPPPVIYCSTSNPGGLDTIGTLGGCSITGAYNSQQQCIAGATNGTPTPTGAGTPYTLVMTITAGTTAGTVNDTLTIQNKSGSVVMNFPLNYTILAKSNRTVTFKNYCPFNVWFGADPGAVPGSITACPNGTTSNGTSCVWNQPALVNAEPGYFLAEYPGTGVPASNSVTIPDNTTGQPQIDGFQVWSGNFFGRTHCDGNGQNCETADCSSASGATGSCTVGATAPATLAEFTLLTTQSDSYDVSVINGVNLAMSITPNVQQGTSKPYDCGVPGSTSTVSYSDGLYNSNGVLATPITGGLAGASWSFTPPSNNLLYQYVDGNPGVVCTANSGCGTDKVCGLTSANVALGNATLTCGVPLGYWTQDQICTTNPNFANADKIVDCTAGSIQAPPQTVPPTILTSCTNSSAVTTGSCPFTVQPVAGNYTFFNLVAGTTAPPVTPNDKLTFASCFAAITQTASSLNCSGCNNWQDSGISPFPSDPNFVPQCDASVATTTPNPSWVHWVLPNIVWLKQACPSCYTYPYDDKTSGFGCPYAYETGQSAVNYTVTFCPGQKTGIPTANS